MKMKIPEHITKQLKERGGKYTTDFIHMNARIKADNQIALKQICAEQRWLIGNVIDWLIEGFIADYRQMWPVEGMYQTQLTDELHSPESKPPQILKANMQHERVIQNPDYYSKAWPDIVLLRGLVKDYRWDTEAEQRLKDIAANTTEEWTRDNINTMLEVLKERFSCKPKEIIGK